uniref:C-type lectin domain-containing protein n=1 Tax=Calidris pygmaea TaxID=425635 RepID=A0A8C3K4N6_9CHAR
MFCLFPVKKCPSCPSCPSPVLPSCWEKGIGFGEKCFYFVEEEADWNGSESSCLALGAHLATIDTWEELVNEKSPRIWGVHGFRDGDLEFI